MKMDYPTGLPTVSGAYRTLYSVAILPRGPEVLPTVAEVTVVRCNIDLCLLNRQS